MANLLMSIDLEDARLSSKEGLNYKSRVEKNTEQFIQFLKSKNWPCTFFTVGNIFKSHPDLIRYIQSQGYEVAWHSSEHKPVANMSQEEFYADLMDGKELANKFGIELKGYRAPIFSVNSETHWFHKTLNKAGFKYSSSVLPAKSPLYGWPEFGFEPRMVDGIFEISMQIADFKFLKVPYGGIYLRVLPSLLFKYSIQNQMSAEQPLATYIHPYDFDTEQERYMNGKINENKFYNYFKNIGRKKHSQ